MIDGIKQVLHVQPAKGFDAAEGRENERRWSDDKYAKKNLDPDNNYDKTRRDLNFEIGPDGKIHPLGYQEKPLEQRLQDRLKELGWHPFKEGSKNQPNMAAEFIFGGNHERMLEMAFGDQHINLEKSQGADNSHLKRMPEIEQWTQDVYQWLDKRFGHENIVGFQVHLDEHTPHVHALVVPVGTRKKSGRQFVSWASKFGKDGTSYGNTLREMHTSFFEEIGQKYGLERGDSVVGRDVHHLNKRQYIRKLERDYQKALKALKGLQTMISNNEAIITQQEQLIESLNRDVETGKLSAEEAERRKEQAQRFIAQKEAIIAEKNEKISVKEAYLSQLTREIKEAGVTISAYRNPKADVSPPQISSQPGIFQSFNNWKLEENKRLAEAFWKTVDYIEDVYKRDAEAQVNEAKNSKLVDYSELLQLRSESKEADQGNDFLNRILCMLIDQFLDPILHAQVSALATALFDGTYVPTSGGGGCSSDLRWDGRNPGEEEDDYRRRCLTTAAAVIHRQTSRTKSPKR